MTTSKTHTLTDNIRFRSAKTTAIAALLLAATHYLSMRTDALLIDRAVLIMAALILVTLVATPIVLIVRTQPTYDLAEAIRLTVKSWGWGLLAILAVWMLYGTALISLLPLS